MKIRAKTLHVFKKVHTWTGLMAGLLLFIAFYAGSLTVFREEITDWQYQEYDVSSAQALALVPKLLEKVLAKDANALNGVFVKLPGDHQVLPMARWRAGDAQAGYASIDINGEVTFSAPNTKQLSIFVDELHRNAGIPGLAGETIMGIAALIYALALVSGTILYLPVFVKSLFALRVGENVKRFWLDIHNSIGVISLPFHIVFALTGSVMLLHDPMMDVINKLIYPDHGRQLLMQTVSPAPAPKPNSIDAPALPLNTILANVSKAYPKLKPSAFIFEQPGKEQGTVYVMGSVDNVLAHSSSVVLSASDGRILGQHTPESRPHGTTALSGFRALHFGDYGYKPVQWIYLILGLAGALLFYSGNLLWLETRRKKRLHAKPKSHQVLTSLTLGVCLGSCLGISTVFVASRFVEDIAFTSIYWLVFFIALVWACIRPASKAVTELLCATSIASLCIPITSLLLNQKLHSVDFMAIVFSLVFMGFTLMLHKRCKAGKSSVYP
jgi:uncharacterized iron-regulated membrane protein